MVALLSMAALLHLEPLPDRSDIAEDLLGGQVPDQSRGTRVGLRSRPFQDLFVRLKCGLYAPQMTCPLACSFLVLFTIGEFLRGAANGQVESVSVNTRNAQAVAEIVNGSRTVANAAWWGFDPADSTETLQAAVNSKATTLIVPYMGAPWVIRPIQLRGRQEIIFEPGVVMLAKKGEFRGTGDSLLSIVGQSNLVLRGYGAILRMHKPDYQAEPYKKGEWRMGIAIRGCKNVLIEGLRVESTGGDGFYVDGGADRGWSEDITIRNCTAYDNHRQGLSVISAMNLAVENCVFASTRGTPPEAGIDLEPDTEENRLVNCLIRNTVFQNNNGHQVLIHLKPLSRKSMPVSIRFENCLAQMNDGRGTTIEPTPGKGLSGAAGIVVEDIRDDGPSGTIEFDHCVTQRTSKESLRIYDKSSQAVRVRFVNCAFNDSWASHEDTSRAVAAPIVLALRHPELTTHFGGLDFIDCNVYDHISRPPMRFEDRKGAGVLADVKGTILVRAPGYVPVDLGQKRNTVDVKTLFEQKNSQ